MMGAIAGILNVIFILIGTVAADKGSWAAAAGLWMLVFLDVADSVIQAIKGIQK